MAGYDLGATTADCALGVRFWNGRVPGARRLGWYDAYGRLEKVVDPLQGVTLYAYDAYDTLNRLTNLAAVLNGTTPVTNFTYVYDNAGNRTRKQQLDYTEDYGYDPLYRYPRVDVVDLREVLARAHPQERSRPNRNRA